MLDKLTEKQKKYLIAAIVVAAVIISMLIPVDLNATVGDIGSNSNDKEIVNAQIAKVDGNKVRLKILAEPKDFYLDFYPGRSADFLVGHNALIQKSKNDNLDGKYQYDETVALSRKGNLFELIVKTTGLNWFDLYSGKLTNKSYSA